MSRQIICVTQAIALEQLTNTFKKVSGVCVVDDEKRLIGVVSRKDLNKEGVGCSTLHTAGSTCALHSSTECTSRWTCRQHLCAA
jgi:CBS-domain-containing membrane protein